MKKYLLKISVIILLLFNSCIARYHYPKSVDIPLIKNKGDIRLDIGGFVVHDLVESALPGGQVTFSAGLTNIVAIQTHVSVDAVDKIHLQGAMGLYKKIDNKTVIELYNGYGYGFYNVHNNDNTNKYHLTFSQLNIGRTDIEIGAKKYIDYGLGLKGGHIFVDNADYENAEFEYFFKKFYKENVWMFEPSIFFRFGGRKAKVYTRVNYNITKKEIDVIYIPLSISAGVNFSFGKR